MSDAECETIERLLPVSSYIYLTFEVLLDVIRAYSVHTVVKE